jgi:hypothetical protein
VEAVDTAWSDVMKTSGAKLGACCVTLLLAWQAAACGNGDTPGSAAVEARAPEAGQAGLTNAGSRPTFIDLLQLPVPRTFDLSHVEAAHFAAALGRDPDRVFEFVRDQIAFEPYPGALRGPRGTLMALAGNSVDRAMLLADLLINSGQRVRYVRGTLPEPVARDLATSIWAERAGESSGNRDASPGERSTGELLVASIRRDGTLLRDALKGAGYPRASPTAVTLEALVRETQDHYWIQWSRNGTWTDLDPSFGAAKPGQAYAQAQETFDTLPDALFHRIEVRIRVEEYDAGAPSIREVLRSAFRAADLSGRDFVLAHETEAGAQDAGRVRPLLLLGEQRLAGEPFNVVPPRQTTVGAFLDAFGGGGDETVPAGPIATAESVEMDFTAPGGRTTTVVREIFDRVGAMRRCSGARLDQERVTNASEINADELVGGLYDFFFTTGAIHTAHLNGVVDPPAAQRDEVLEIGLALRRISLGFAAASDALVTRMADPERALVSRVYLDTPRVQVAEMSTKGRTQRLSLDLRRDDARVVVTGFSPEQIFFTQVLRGVINGSLERFVLDQFVGPDETSADSEPAGLSTSLLFDVAHASGMATAVLARDGVALPQNLAPDVRARVENALALGQVAVAPDRPVVVAGAPRFAWWQVDPASGATIGVTEEGLHQNTAEATITRAKDGNFYFRIIYRGNLRRKVARTPSQAARFVRNLTSEYERAGITILWRSIIL